MEYMSLKRLVAYLKTLRPEGKPTLREVAQKSGLDQGFLSKLEAGSYESVSVDTLRKIALGYGVPFETLLSEAGYLEGGPSPVPELSTYLRTHVGLSEDGVKEVESFIEYARKKYGRKRARS